MAKLLFLRMASGAGILTLAIFMVGLIPFLGAVPSAGAVLPGVAPDISVNRMLKGDRLPLAADLSGLQKNSLTPTEIPVGCDAAFSPISAPKLAYIFRRCMT